MPTRPDPPGGGQRIDLPAPLASGSDEQRRLGVGPRERAGDHRRDRRGAQAGHDRRVEQGGRHPRGRIGDEDRTGEPLAGLAVERREAPVQLRPDDSSRLVEGDSARRQVEGAAPEPVQVEPSRTEGASLAVGPERSRDRVDAVRKRRQLERVAPCEHEHAPMLVQCHPSTERRAAHGRHRDRGDPGLSIRSALSCASTARWTLPWTWSRPRRRGRRPSRAPRRRRA